jgi:calcium/calmodulin-dependent protein kinase I
MKLHNIVHRDLKPSNILLNKNEANDFDVRIADFGLSATQLELCMHKVRVQCGTPGYIAPEILRSETCSSKSDIFSIGSILFTILTGKVLFSAVDMNLFLRRNKECNLAIIHLFASSMSASVMDLLLKLLNPDPTLRPSAQEALSHEWFS